MGSAMDKRTIGNINPLTSQLLATRHKEGLCSREGEEDTAERRGGVVFPLPMAGSRLMEVHPFVPCAYAREVWQPALVLTDVFDAETAEV
jgi:hypothetical protein